MPTEESDLEGVNVSTPDEEPQGVRQNANETGRLWGVRKKIKSQ